MTDFRALCAELLEIIGFLCEGDSRPDCDIVARARAYLAQPEPEGLTEWGLLDLGNDVMGNPLPCDPDLLLAFARAVIAADRARCGRPAVEPDAQ